jgi:hypothetical protein
LIKKFEILTPPRDSDGFTEFLFFEDCMKTCRLGIFFAWMKKDLERKVGLVEWKVWI